jgi:hypothetical protein
MINMAVPEVVPYLLAILGLLLIWQLHDIQVKAGRIKAADILHRSNIRLFIHVTPEDAATCPACRDANGKAFLPVTVTAKRFSALDAPCTNHDGCRCLLIGLYGAWPEAQAVQSELTAGAPVRLAHKDLDHLIDGGKTRRHGVESDRLSLAMLEATRAESWDAELAIERYGEVLKHAKADRDVAFVVPCYLRMCELLEKSISTGTRWRWWTGFSTPTRRRRVRARAPTGS